MRFNTISLGTKTVNFAGGQAYRESAKLELVSTLLTSFVKDQFYRSAEDGLDRVRGLIQAIPDKSFCAKAAIYARTRFGMRSISHVVAGELAHTVKGAPWMKHFLNQVIYRPDDMLEILAYYQARYGKHPIPNAVKKGFALALPRFSAYQLAKYRGEGKSVKLLDVVNLIHPRPNEYNTATLKALMTGELASTETWEAKLTQAGQADEEDKEELKAAAWHDLLATRKLGYFALLRNLRNILQQAPQDLDLALEMLTDKDLIHKSLVLPFRFQTALIEIQKLSESRTRDVLIALVKALDIAIDNVPSLPGKTLIALDVSGSMTNGGVIPIAALFATALYKRSDTDLILFDDKARYCTLNPLDSTATLTQLLCQMATGGGTDFHIIFQCVKRPYDRIIILSDMQGWIGHTSPAADFSAYKQKYNIEPKVFSWDLQGYGTLQFPEKNVYCLAGFSEKVFDLMALLEESPQAMIEAIEQVELCGSGA